MEAERAWLALAPRVPAHVSRLAGIYGPFRSALDSVRRAPPRPADAEGRGRGGAPAKFVSRVHVDDICAALLASARRPLPGEVPPTGALELFCALSGEPPPLRPAPRAAPPRLVR